MLSQKTALISGGSDGIGRAIAETFAQAGAHVIICARSKDKLEATQKAIQDAGGNCTIEVLDLSDARAFGALVDKYAKNGLDILINNAPHVGYGMISDTDLDDFQVNFSINVNAAYAGIQAAMKHMAKKGGSIINISSINGARAMQGMSGYSASKAALDHLTRAASMEGARQNIRVNGIAPGPIMTPGTEVFFNSDPAAGEAIANANPMGRIGNPKEVAQVALFLASDMSSYVNGAIIPVDGGKANELHVPQ
ncbi:MAG: SDR family NAD(P)-dependent oxidoreductase [Parvibaculales bacterium]